MSELAKGVAKLVCIVQVKTGDDGKMFGSVTTGMIADQLKQQFDISLDKRKVHIEHAIRALGEYDVELRLHQEVTATLKIRVESTTPLPAPAEPPATDARREDRGERRGRRGETQAESAPKAGMETTEGGEHKSRPARAERPPRAEKPAKAEKAPKGEKPAKPAKSEKAE
jgi:large subunit ribosomal protein L9